MSAYHRKEDNVPNTDKGHPRCQEVVSHNTSWPSFGQCERRAKVDGKWCKVHDPEYVDAKRAAKDAALPAGDDLFRYDTDGVRENLANKTPDRSASKHEIVQSIGTCAVGRGIQYVVAT